MSGRPDWLPPLVQLQESGGSWERYEERVYELIFRDFVASDVSFQGRPVYVTKQLLNGKERTFWHCISQGDVEEKRTPDLQRCERIRWIRAVIEHADDPVVKSWSNRRGRSTREVLWLEAAEYLVVLEDRRKNWILWTAYCTDRPHTQRKLRREYEAARK